MGDHYPTYLSKTIVSFLAGINMMISSYLFSSTELNEWVELFYSENFTDFFVISLILAIGWHLNILLRDKLFDQIFTDIANIFEPIITILMLYALGVTYLPG